MFLEWIPLPTVFNIRTRHLLCNRLRFPVAIDPHLKPAQDVPKQLPFSLAVFLNPFSEAKNEASLLRDKFVKPLLFCPCPFAWQNAARLRALIPGSIKAAPDAGLHHLYEVLNRGSASP